MYTYVCLGHDPRVDGVLERGQDDDPGVRVQAAQRPRVRDQLLPEDVRGRPARHGTPPARQPPEHVHHDQSHGRVGGRGASGRHTRGHRQAQHR